MLPPSPFVHYSSAKRLHYALCIIHSITFHRMSVCLLPPLCKGKQAKKPRWGLFAKRVTENAKNEARLCRARILNIFSGRARVPNEREAVGLFQEKTTLHAKQPLSLAYARQLPLHRGAFSPPPARPSAFCYANPPHNVRARILAVFMNSPHRSAGSPLCGGA